MLQQEEYVQFFTAPILEWKHLLKPDKYKQIILDSLRFLVVQKRVKVYGFGNYDQPHSHHLAHTVGTQKRKCTKDFLKYTAQQIKSDLEKHDPKVLSSFLVNAKDRKYQLWERNPLSVDIWSGEVLWQKLRYMHQNPVRAGVCQWPQQYRWSSATFYHNGIDNFGWLTHVMD
jgi:putative transposase